KLLVICFVSGFVFFFFFQAEDGIRDLTVTGVQTCALPIWRAGQRVKRGKGVGIQLKPCLVGLEEDGKPRISLCFGDARKHLKNRSEERRVGKECRYRWAQDQ